MKPTVKYKTAPSLIVTYACAGTACGDEELDGAENGLTCPTCGTRWEADSDGVFYDGQDGEPLDTNYESYADTVQEIDA